MGPVFPLRSPLKSDINDGFQTDIHLLRTFHGNTGAIVKGVKSLLDYIMGFHIMFACPVPYA